MTIKNYVGAIGMLPFPLGEKRSSDFANDLDDLLGKCFPLGEGVEAVLVEASAATTDIQSNCLEWSDDDAFQVIETNGTASPICGICHPYQQDLAANDFFFMLRPVAAGAVITVIASTAINKAAIVTSTSAGQAVTDSAYVAGETFGKTMEAATDQGDTVMVRCYVDGFVGLPV